MTEGGWPVKEVLDKVTFLAPFDGYASVRAFASAIFVDRHPSSVI